MGRRAACMAPADTSLCSLPLWRRWKHISFVDDNSAFVLLPSHVHAQELLAAAAAGGVRASADGAAADDDDMAGAPAEDSAAGGGGGGMNMLGLPGVDHVMRALPAAEAQAQAPEAPQQQSIWAGLPDDLAALIPQPPRLTDFRWESYAQYLARRADIYGAGACVPSCSLPTPSLTHRGPASVSRV